MAMTVKPPSSAFGRFLRLAALLTLLPLLALLAFNLASQDSIVRAGGGADFEAAAFKGRIRANKALAVERLAPAVVIVGNSRALYAYRPEHPGWPQRPVYNLALEGATLYEYGRYLTHAAAVRRPELVVVSFDLIAFTSAETQRADFEELALRTDEAGAEKPWPLGNRLFASLSFDLLEDNVAHLLGSDDGEANRFRQDGLRDGGEFLARAARNPEGQRGFFQAIDRRIASNLKDCRLALPRAERFAELRRLVGFAVERGIPLRLVFDPVHLRRLLIYRLTGGLASYAEVKRRVTEIAAAARAAGGDVRVFDFSGLSPYVTELPAADPAAPPATWFYESSHFTPALGDRILDQLLGTAPPPGDFGAELLPETLEDLLRRQSVALETWIAANPAVPAEMAALLAEGCAAQKSK